MQPSAIQSPPLTWEWGVLGGSGWVQCPGKPPTLPAQLIPGSVSPFPLAFHLHRLSSPEKKKPGRTVQVIDPDRGRSHGSMVIMS